MKNKIYTILLMLLIIIEGVLIVFQTNAIYWFGKIINDKNNTIEIIQYERTK